MSKKTRKRSTWKKTVFLWILFVDIIVLIIGTYFFGRPYAPPIKGTVTIDELLMPDDGIKRYNFSFHNYSENGAYGYLEYKNGENPIEKELLDVLRNSEYAYMEKPKGVLCALLECGLNAKFTVWINNWDVEWSDEEILEEEEYNYVPGFDIFRINDNYYLLVDNWRYCDVDDADSELKFSVYKAENSEALRAIEKYTSKGREMYRKEYPYWLSYIRGSYARRIYWPKIIGVFLLELAAVYAAVYAVRAATGKNQKSPKPDLNKINKDYEDRKKRIEKKFKNK